MKTNGMYAQRDRFLKLPPVRIVGLLNSQLLNPVGNRKELRILIVYQIPRKEIKFEARKTLKNENESLVSIVYCLSFLQIDEWHNFRVF